MRTGRVLTALALALLAGLWGLSFALGPQEERVDLEAIAIGPEDGESEPVLRPGEAVQSSLSFVNRGLTGCKLRVRLCVPQIDGQPVLQAGHMGPGGFAGAGSGGNPEGEYWTAGGAYLYYKNSRTGDLLPPGQETPPLYTAVMLNARIDPEAISALREMSPQQQLYALPEAKPQGEGPWREAVPPA